MCPVVLYLAGVGARAMTPNHKYAIRRSDAYHSYTGDTPPITSPIGGLVVMPDNAEELWVWTGERDAAGCLMYELRERPEPEPGEPAALGAPDSAERRSPVEGSERPEVIEALRAAREQALARRRRERTVRDEHARGATDSRDQAAERPNTSAGAAASSGRQQQQRASR